MESEHMKKFTEFKEAFAFAVKNGWNVIDVHSHGIHCVSPKFVLDRQYFHEDGRKTFFSTLVYQKRVHVLNDGLGKYVGHTGYDATNMSIRIQFDSGNASDFHPDKLRERLVPLLYKEMETWEG